MAVTFLIPFFESQYRRDFEAEIDVQAANEIFVRGKMRDHRFEFEHTWKVRTPEYDILEVDARQIAGDQDLFDPELCGRYAGIKDIRIGRGFTKHILSKLGDLPGRQEHLWLAIEMARVAQQVYQYTPEFEARFQLNSNSTKGEAYLAWLKDRAYMPDLANTCFTYSDETEELFKTREVRCGFGPEIYRPKPGDQRFFWRNKFLAVDAKSVEDGRSVYACESAMEDRIHDIKINFDLSCDGVISNAQSRGLRLPYHGICEDAQLRTGGLNGKQVTASYVLQFADRIGGKQGCTHLFDLSIDCLRLFRFM